MGREYVKGTRIFSEGDPSSFLYTIIKGRVKIVKSIPAGKELILEILGAGDPLGAVAAYESRPYPASAFALEDTTCLVSRQAGFLGLLETCPTLVRGLLVGFSFRLIELTTRLSELTGSRVEARLAQLFLKLADRLGKPQGGGQVRIPLSLSRQDLADLAGTTIETSIRIMSRWGKGGLVMTEDDGFVLRDRAALEALVA